MNAFVTEAFTLLAIGVTTIGIRTYARWQTVGFKGFKPDDYLMLLAAVVYSFETAAAYIVGAWWHGLANNGMSDEQRLNIVVGSEEWNMRIGGSKTQLVGWSLYTLLLWLLKLCMCIFYARLTEGVDDMRGRVLIGYGALAVTYLATELSILLGCQPFHHNWQIRPDPGTISKIDLYVTVILNVLTDMYLMSIPMPMLWRAKIPTPRKILLLGMFGGGVFIMAAGILRCILILRDPIGGAQQAGSWAVRETFVAVIIGNIPMIYPFFRRTTRKLLDSSFFDSINLSRNTKSQADQNGDFHGGSWQEGSNGKKRFGGGRTLYPLSTIGDGSEERIVGDKEMGLGKVARKYVNSVVDLSQRKPIDLESPFTSHDLTLLIPNI
ncbi:hypothetical protein M7I_5652 [Glarea lozoyensis 74030]|uniref:Rhodopsin domain-containing protein n=1 Tax=Glarea lozoyensis (strain ATCC 74030 / MF5533) TaxID=1104152 RepID=H0ESG6_GLAL7|nr:hypothetical protein M7I_5652 [Glarea lozoyensis 74030]